MGSLTTELSGKPDAGSVYTQMFSFTRLVLTAVPHSPFRCVVACIIIPHYSLPNLQGDWLFISIDICAMQCLALEDISLPSDLLWPVEHKKKYQVPYLSRKFKGHHMFCLCSFSLCHEIFMFPVGAVAPSAWTLKQTDMEQSRSQHKR